MKVPTENRYEATLKPKAVKCLELQRLSVELRSLLKEKSSLREQIESAILDPGQRRATLTLLTSKIDQALRSIAEHEKPCDCVSSHSG